jgi:hypothetical protein
MMAMVLSALAPTVAHAWVAAADEGQWIEVCSVSGMVWLKADGPEASADTATGSNMPMADMAQHCPWCSFHGASAGLPPATLDAAVAVHAEHAMPGWIDMALPQQPRLRALARAPPFSS